MFILHNHQSNTIKYRNWLVFFLNDQLFSNILITFYRFCIYQVYSGVDTTTHEISLTALFAIVVNSHNSSLLHTTAGFLQETQFYWTQAVQVYVSARYEIFDSSFSRVGFSLSFNKHGTNHNSLPFNPCREGRGRHMQRVGKQQIIT